MFTPLVYSNMSEHTGCGSKQLDFFALIGSRHLLLSIFYMSGFVEKEVVVVVIV